jgi:tetratricopeptide (TPR) repeat protein
LSYSFADGRWGGLFLLELGNPAAAEAPIRRAVSIYERNMDPAIDTAREGLGRALEAQGKHDEALALFRRAAAGSDGQVAARSFAKLAELDPERADTYYRNGIASEEKASGADSPRVAILLHDYAQVLRARDRDPEAEPLLWRALAIQQAAKADARVTIGILNMLGNLLEGRQQLDEAEKLERTALALSEEKFGPESSQLATTCTNLARPGLKAPSLQRRRRWCRSTYMASARI